MNNGTHQNGTRPSAVAPAHDEQALDWDALAPRVNQALAQPLRPELVARRSGRGGRRFRYLEGHSAIDQANQVFGYGGWGYELIGEVQLRSIESTEPRSGELRRSCAYSATVRVSVPGAPSRTDVGFQPVTDESAEAHETAYKGAVTDALKRALRSFGDRFGNGLYGDPPATATPSQPTRQPQPSPAAPPADRERRPSQPPAARPQSAPPSRDDEDARQLRAQLIELSQMQGFSEQQVREAVRRKTGRELDQLGVAELNPLIASAADKLERRQTAHQG